MTLSFLLGIWIFSGVGGFEQSIAQRFPGINSFNNRPAAFQVQRFRPWSDSNGLFQTESARTNDALQTSIALFTHFSSTPLTITSMKGSQPVISEQLGLDIIVAVGLLPWLEVSIAAPATLFQTGDHRLLMKTFLVQFLDINGFAMADLRFGAKFGFTNQREHGVELGLRLEVTAPTGDSQRFNGEDGVSFSAALLLSRSYYGFNFAMNLGYRKMPASTIADLLIEHELFYSFGLSYLLQNKQLMFLVDFLGFRTLNTSLENSFAPEVLLGMRIYPSKQVPLGLSIGGSFSTLTTILRFGHLPTTPYGFPVYRFFLGIVWRSSGQGKDKRENGR